MKPSVNLASLQSQSLFTAQIVIPLAIVFVLVLVGLFFFDSGGRLRERGRRIVQWLLGILRRHAPSTEETPPVDAVPPSERPDTAKEEPALPEVDATAQGHAPAQVQGGTEAGAAREVMPANSGHDYAPAQVQGGTEAGAAREGYAPAEDLAPIDAPSFWKSKYAIALSVSSFFVLTLFLFAAARIYISNFMEFDFLFHESLLFFLALSFAATAVAFIVLIVLSRKPRTFRTVVSVLFMLAFLMWYQANIFLWQYGTLNGSDIEWRALARFGIMDSVFWAVMLAFAVVRSGLVYRLSRVVGLFFILLQLLSVGQLWLAMPKNQSFKAQQPDANAEFVFSSHVNVIVLVLDTFQSDIFQEIVNQDPKLAASFDGFTYFRNALAGSDATSVSIPNMLTGVNYDNSIPYLDYVKTSFLENSLPKTLLQYGFSNYLFPIIKYSVYTDFPGVERAKRIFDWEAFFREQAFLADLALFRNLPHFIKMLVYNDQNWLFSRLWQPKGAAAGAGPFASTNGENLTFRREFVNSNTLLNKNRDVNFIHRMMPAAKVAENTETFKFYHLNGMHLQLVMNRDVEYVPLQPTRENMLLQGAGVLKIASMFLDRLRQLGAYNDSLIFIVGDHGCGLSVASLNPTGRAKDFNKGSVYTGLFSNFKSAGIPMILVKRIGAKGKMKTSDAPVSLCDIPQTVVEELGIDGRFPGKSMFRVKEGEKRERIYRPFYGPQEDVEYFAPLYEYAVNGFSWDDASWRETGNIYYGKK